MTFSRETAPGAIFGLLLLIGPSQIGYGQQEHFLWPNALPADTPFSQSGLYRGIEFTGRHVRYGNADTWYPSWANDGALYSPFMDGNVNGVTAMFDQDTTGNAKITGGDPMNLSVQVLGLSKASAVPYHGRYPSASLIKDGIWYYGTYTLDDLNGSCGNWCKQGPFVGFRVSKDGGRTWTETSHTPSEPLFEKPSPHGKVQIGPAHFVDFGQEMRYSPDGKAYLLAHGTRFENGFSNWIAGDDLYLARVTPSLKRINDPKAWEFYAGNDLQGKPKWSRKIDEMRPLLEWRGHLGSATITYDTPLRRYLLCVSRPDDGFASDHDFDSMIMESPSLTGPWKVVIFMKDFGPQAYFLNIPSKFISADGKAFWLAYSANFSDKDKLRGEPSPAGSGYALTLQEVKLLNISNTVVHQSQFQNHGTHPPTAACNTRGDKLRCPGTERGNSKSGT